MKVKCANRRLQSVNNYTYELPTLNKDLYLKLVKHKEFPSISKRNWFC